MAYVTVEDVAATWEQYERSFAALVDPVPVGLILHAAGKTDEGYRIVGVWESEAAWQRFRSSQPGADGPDPAGMEHTRFRDLRPDHFVTTISTRGENDER